MTITNEKVKFKVNEKIFCASHGVGTLTKIEKKEYFGTTLELYSIFFEKEKIELMVPAPKLKEFGIRHITSKDMMNKIIKGVVMKAPKIGKGIWTKRIVECETKLFSGSIFLIAEVVRDLFPGTRDANRSYSERSLFDKAFNRFIEEISISLSITIEEANRVAMEALCISSPAAKDVPAVEDSISENSGSDEGDFDDEVESLDELDSEEGVSKKRA